MKECEYCHEEVADEAQDCGCMKNVGDVCGCCGRTLIATKDEEEDSEPVE